MLVMKCTPLIISTKARLRKKSGSFSTKFVPSFLLSRDVMYVVYVAPRVPITVAGHAVYSMNRLRPLELWVRGFESHSRYGCSCAFILYFCYPVCG
jgi:hypothetical protein